jgi:hypothetical protein
MLVFPPEIALLPLGKLGNLLAMKYKVKKLVKQYKANA